MSFKSTISTLITMEKMDPALRSDAVPAITAVKPRAKLEAMVVLMEKTVE